MLKLRTSLNYYKRARLSCFYVNHQDVIEIDTSVDTAMKNSNSDTETAVKGEYLNNDVPVEVFGHSILMTEYDPILSKKRSAAKKASEAQHAQTDPSVNTVQQNAQTAAASQAAAQNVES